MNNFLLFIFSEISKEFNALRLFLPIPNALLLEPIIAT